MSKKIFVNLPVADLKKSMSFFQALGFIFNPQFTEETAACMVISEDIYAMLLTHAKFATFIPNPISDAHQSTEVLVCLSCESREEVDVLVSKALKQGGKTFRPSADHGFMYEHAFRDPDGHIWELAWMNQGAAH